jgi:hypothetical protein
MALAFLAWSATQRRGEQGLEDVLDLTQADTGGKGDGGHLAEFGGVADHRLIGSSAQIVELIAEPLILDEKFGVIGLASRRGELLFDPVGVLVDRLATASGLLGLASDGAVGPREDGGGVADPGAER